MKAGVEDSHLRNYSKSLRDDVDSFHLYAIMQRRKRSHLRNGGLDVRCDDRRLLVFVTSVHDAVTHDLNLGRFGNGVGLAGTKGVEQQINSLLTRFNPSLFFELFTLGRLNSYLCLLAVPFDIPFPNGCGRKLWQRVCDVIERHFLAARTGIEHQYFHCSVGPLPIADFRKIVSVLADVFLVLNQLLSKEMLEMCR